ILLPAIALLLMVLNLFLLHFDPANLIPFYPAQGKRVAPAKVYWAKSEIKGWEEALRRFYGEWGYWPKSLEELKKKAGGRVPGDTDPWGNRYRYRVEEVGFHITSVGEDGIEGTEDDIRGGEA
ncbi:MAG: type II secretion system protein GspG, partial [candidate division NC10 bacterium]|nr:type II secretion system protein GspG [candidate division NC10 bacterium]